MRNKCCGEGDIGGHTCLDCPHAAQRKEPFNVRCKPCQHAWTAAYLPLPITAMGELLKGLRCPMCGADSNEIFMHEELSREPQ